MSNFTTFQHIAPVKVMFNRLLKAQQGTGLLSSVKKIYPYPLKNIQGEADLPLICLFDFEHIDSTFYGEKSGPGTPSQKLKHVNVNIRVEAKIFFRIAVSRERGGLFQDEGGLAPGLLDILYAFEDTIQRKLDGVTPDCGLDATCKEPVEIAFRGTKESEIAWEGIVEVKYFPSPTKCATRTSPWIFDAQGNSLAQEVEQPQNSA